MKILTLNTHSLVEENYEEKLLAFVDMLKIEIPDIIALQEVNQSMALPVVEDALETGYIPCKDCQAVIRTDNHAYRLAKMLQKLGMPYQWTWIPAKIGYAIYDEGIAIFSKIAIEDTHSFHISAIRDYRNWKTRKVLGICTKGIWYYSLHMGWWNDEEDPFVRQWKLFMEQANITSKPCFIMGDFNSPENKENQGYTCVLCSGWQDTWQLAETKDRGITVGHVIDGWDDKISDEADFEKQGMRIDYIFCNQNIPVKCSQVVCNGNNYPIVSDHYGVLIEIEEK